MKALVTDKRRKVIMTLTAEEEGIILDDDVSSPS